MRSNPEDSHLIEVYEKSNGYKTAKKVLLQESPEKVLEEIKDSNIRGRGGAGFPTGIKWGFLAEDEERYLVINADESEPGTFKDKLYLEQNLHKFFEGMLIAAWAVEAKDVYIYLRDEYPGIRKKIIRELDILKKKANILNLYHF